MIFLRSRHRRSARIAVSLAAATLLGSSALIGSPGAYAVPAGALDTSTVFARGQDGYHTFRIPAIAEAADGTLLAFAEARVNSPGDDGDIDMVVKRSTDRGRTWGPLQVVADDGPNKWGNPVPIVDRRTGRIILNTTRTGGDVSSSDVRCGRADAEQTRRSFIQYSDDNGATWSAPVEITAQVRPDSWRHFVGGPGHGLQLTKGAHAGRLVIPGNHSVAAPPGQDCLSGSLFGAHSLYSDDGGVTWHLGGVDDPLTGAVAPNESSATELADGTVYFSARDQGGTPGRRVDTTSGNGGQSFDHPYQAVNGVVTSQVQGSVLALPPYKVDSRLVLSAPGHPTARENLTLWSSFDQAATWRSGLVVYDGPAGYSDLVEVDPGTLGVLFENGDRLDAGATLTYHQRISFARIPVNLLDTPSVPALRTPDTSGHGLDGVVSGGPALAEGVFGQAFDLAGDYVELPLTGSLSFGGGAFTAAAWFRTSASEDQAILWGHATGDGEPKWWIRLEPGQNRVRALVDTGTASRFVPVPGTFNDGEWHHVALTRDENGLVMYVDGVRGASAAPVAGSVSDNARTGIRVGSRVDGVNNPFRGSMDEVWLFDRALTAAEVGALAAGNVAPAGAQLHLPLDQKYRRG